MESSAETEHIQREFGHCVVNWEIENYGFAAHGMEYEIKSPLFSVRPHMTTWTLALKSKLGLCDDTEVMFSLERMIDSGPDTICVNMDISLFDQDGKKWNGPHGQYLTERNDRIALYVPNIYFGRVNMSLYNFNSMTVRCQMIVHEEKSQLWRYDCLDNGLKGLAIDLERLYKFTEFNDITFELEDGSKRAVAHRAILSARSEVLKEEFNKKALSCPSLHYHEASQVLKYLYTSDVTNILNQPSVSTADCISAFSLHELEDLYKADEQKLKSKIDVHQTGLMWTIENFSKRDEECITSRMISGDIVEMAWVLRLYPRGIGGKDEYFTIIAENMEGKIDGDMWAKIEVYHDSYDRSWRAMKVVKEGELFELHNFESRKSVFEKLEKDNLKICFKVCVSTGETHSSNTQQVFPLKHFPCDYYFKKLSRDISSLREDTKFTDIVVSAGGKEFKAHKCLLSVRSSVLSKLPEDQSLDEDTVIYVENVRSDIVEIVLDYLYSGVLKTLDFNTLLIVYEAAWKMGVCCLICECSQVLLKNLNEDNVYTILVKANVAGDDALKEGIFEFLKLSLNVSDNILKQLNLEDPILSVEVQRALSNLQLN